MDRGVDRRLDRLQMALAPKPKVAAPRWVMFEQDRQDRATFTTSSSIPGYEDQASFSEAEIDSISAAGQHRCLIIMKDYGADDDDDDTTG